MRIKSSLIVIYTFLAVGLIMLSGINYSFAASGAEQYNNGLQSTAGGAGYDLSSDTYGEGKLTATIAKVIQIILSFVGVIFLILMIYAGYTWMVAAGNEQQVEKARKVLIASIIGMLIVLSAYAISYLVILKFGNASLQESASSETIVPDW